MEHRNITISPLLLLKVTVTLNGMCMACAHLNGMLVCMRSWKLQYTVCVFAFSCMCLHAYAYVCDHCGVHAHLCVCVCFCLFLSCCFSLPPCLCPSVPSANGSWCNKPACHCAPSPQTDFSGREASPRDPRPAGFTTAQPCWERNQRPCKHTTTFPHAPSLFLSTLPR